MKRLLGLLVLAFSEPGLVWPAEAAIPGAIDDGGSEPGHGSGDPGPSVTHESEPKKTIGDAEPAPPAAPSPPPHAITRDDDPGPRHRIALVPRFAYRLGDAGRAVPPVNGWGLAGTYEFQYARVGPSIEAALGIDFAFDRFAMDERAPCSDQFTGRDECVANRARTNMSGTFASTRMLSETSFVLVHTITAHLGRLRPFLTLGAGLGVGFFDSVQPDFQPGSAKDLHVLGRAAAGLDVPIWRAWRATVRADFTTVRAASPFTTNGGQTLPLFGDLLDVGVGVAYGF